MNLAQRTKMHKKADEAVSAYLKNRSRTASSDRLQRESQIPRVHRELLSELKDEAKVFSIFADAFRRHNAPETLDITGCLQPYIPLDTSDDDESDGTYSSD